MLLELRRAGLTANPRKCHLALPEAKYLGFQVGRGLIKPQEKKVAAILSAPRPTSKTQVRAFLGLAGYYRCFILNFSSLAAPLTDLTKKGQPEKVPWGPTEEEALRRVKASLTSEPVLRAPDWLGAVLSQIQDGEEHPVIYISRKLTPAEQRYAAVEKEALAVKWAVLELRYYLLGRKFTLITDHAPLQWMARAKDTNARLTRWFLALQDFHLTARHRAGTANTNADGLSRIWAALTGLSGFTPTPISPLTRGARTTLRGGSVTRVPSAYQRRPGNGGETPAPNLHGLIAPSWSGLGDGYKSRRTAHTGEQCLQKISLTHVYLCLHREQCVTDPPGVWAQDHRALLHEHKDTIALFHTSINTPSRVLIAFPWSCNSSARYYIYIYIYIYICSASTKTSYPFIFVTFLLCCVIMLNCFKWLFPHINLHSTHHNDKAKPDLAQLSNFIKKKHWKNYINILGYINKIKFKGKIR